MLNGCAFVVPVLHETTRVNRNVMQIGVAHLAIESRSSIGALVLIP